MTAGVACAIATLSALAEEAPGKSDSAASTARARSGTPWPARVAGLIRANLKVEQPILGNPVAEVELRVGRDGTILARLLVKSSGSPAWDDAVLQAIDRTARLPLDVDGAVPSVVRLTYAKY